MILKILISLCLLFIDAVSASQDSESQASYDPLTGLLKIPVVKVADRYWSAELVDQGGYQFQLKNSAPYIQVVPDVYPTFDNTSGILSIPNLSALGKVWTISLKNSGNLVFKLVTAVEVKIIPTTNPLEILTPKERYVINNDGTVTDTVTNLQWMRCSYGETWTGKTCTGNLKIEKMQNASYAAFLTKFAGKSDWRLPTVDELKTLVYCSSGNPAYWNTIGRGCVGDFQKPTLYLEAFPGTLPAVYWTVTNLQADPGEDYNLTVSFKYGHVYYSYFSDAYEAARFVRGDSNIVSQPELIGGFKE